MNKEELIGKLQMVYVGDKNALNELICYYAMLKEAVELLKKENQKYKEVIDKAIDLIEKSVTTDIGIDSNNNIIHYHQLTEDETGELLDILKEVSK